jgi:alpha-tubulin suppressor-like RCC1 family protein
MPNQFLSDEFGDIEDYFVTDYWLIDQFVGDQLFVWGRSDFAQLGVNDGANRSTPVTTFAGGTTWKSLYQSSGGRSDHTVAIKTDGTLWTWGRGGLGQLGVNDGANRSTPVTTFAGGTNWKSVACGGYNTAAIKTDGTLWIWGNNVFGQLGVNSNVNFNQLTPVTTFSGGTTWKQVACGFRYTAAIKTDGSLWTWGRNNEGQLGDNTTTNRSTPVTTFAGGTNWKSVSCGYNHTAAIKTDGSLWVWGLNTSAQLGTNDGANRSTPVTTFAGGNDWKSVSGFNHTSAIKTDGSLWIWGLNTNGQLGDNTGAPRSTPITTFAGGTNWKSVSCGGSYTTAIKTDGSLWVWGNSDFGQLGNFSTALRLTPVTTFAGGNNWKQVSAGRSHTAAVKSGLNVDLS